MLSRNLGCSVSCLGLERDKFDNKTVTFEEHIKEEHNMWHYLCFIVLVKVKDSTEYTGPESYVAEMIRVSEKMPRGALKAGQPWQPLLYLLSSICGFGTWRGATTKNLLMEMPVLCSPMISGAHPDPWSSCSQGGATEN